VAFPDAPRALRDPAARAARLALVGGPLALYAESLRGPGLLVPDIDPLDGGTSARLLLLLEKPGPGAARGGVVSADNDAPTGEAIFRFLQMAGVDRSRLAIWNAIPWWNGTIRVTGAEERAGLAELPRFLDLLPDLRAVALVGARAGRAEPLLAARGLPTFRSAHPSPQVRAARRDLWDAIPGVWARAAEAAGARG
jgi:hypothetical protein